MGEKFRLFAIFDKDTQENSPKVAFLIFIRLVPAYSITRIIYLLLNTYLLCDAFL